MSHISITNIDVNATQYVTQTEQKLKKRRTLGQASVAGRTHAMRHASHSHRPRGGEAEGSHQGRQYAADHVLVFRLLAPDLR